MGVIGISVNVKVDINTSKGQVKLQVDQNADRIYQRMLATCQRGRMGEWMLLWCRWAVAGLLSSSELCGAASSSLPLSDLVLRAHPWTGAPHPICRVLL